MIDALSDGLHLLDHPSIQPLPVPRCDQMNPVQALDYAILTNSNVLDRLLDLADHPQASHAAAGILLFTTSCSIAMNPDLCQDANLPVCMRQQAPIAQHCSPHRTRLSCCCVLTPVLGLTDLLGVLPAQLSVDGRLFWRSALHWALGSLATAEDPLLPWLAQDLPEIARPSRCADCGQRGGRQVTECNHAWQVGPAADPTIWLVGDIPQ